MKNIINYWFNKKEIPERNIPIEDNTISFTLDKEGYVKINLFFGCGSDKSSEDMGKLLHELNSGMMSQSIIDLMIELGKKNPEYQTFIKNTIMSWFNELPKETAVKDNEPLENSPLIKPSEFMHTTLKGNDR